MTYNPSTYRLTQHPDILQILETALTSPLFLPTETKGLAQSWSFKLDRYRKAHELQSKDWPNATTFDTIKYSWLNFHVKFHDDLDTWGLEIREVDTIPLPGILNADTLQPVGDTDDEQT
jgi:hypothetical protein